jgi:glycosyltransferase involved in cell wall biosynthesis
MRRWDNLLISRFFGAAPMGAYNYAYNLADTPGTAIGEQLNDIIGASFPHVDRDRRPEALVRCCTVLSIVMLPMTVGLAAVAPTVVETFFDPNWSSVAPMLMVLASLSLTRPIAGVVAGYFYASGRPRIVLALECLSLAGLMAALSTLGRASLARACVCVAAVFALRALAGVWLVRRHDQVPMSAFFVPLAKPSAVCAVMAAGVAGVQLACSGLAPPLRLLLEVSAGAAIYASGLRAVARPRYEELMSVLRQAIARGEIDPAPRPLPDRPAVRVLSLSSEFPNPSEPGKGLFVRARLAALASRAHVTVVAPVALLDYANPHGELLGARRIPGERREGSMRVLHPRWVYPPLGGWLNAFFLFAWLLPTVARRCRTVDVIDAHFAHPEGIAAVLLGKVVNRPVVVTVRGSELRYYRQRSKRFWMSWALRRADRVVAVSENLRRLALDLGVDGQRVRTVPNGIHAGTFYPRDRAAARARFDIRPAEAVILSAGDLAELKGHHRVIAAMRDLSARGVRARLLIAGGIGRSGRYAATLRRQVHDDGLSECVTFVGELSQEDLGVLMSAADVFCLASSTEGWPNVVNEALACGTPVVATDVGAVREMVESDGHGYVVPVGDQSALSDALHTALTRAWDREAIAARGRSRSWSQVAGDVLEIMQAVVDARATAPGNGNADERLRQRARLSRSPRIGRA